MRPSIGDRQTCAGRDARQLAGEERGDDRPASDRRRPADPAPSSSKLAPRCRVARNPSAAPLPTRSVVGAAARRSPPASRRTGRAPSARADRAGGRIPRRAALTVGVAVVGLRRTSPPLGRSIGQPARRSVQGSFTPSLSAMVGSTSVMCTLAVVELPSPLARGLDKQRDRSRSRARSSASAARSGWPGMKLGAVVGGHHQHARLSYSPLPSSGRSTGRAGGPCRRSGAGSAGGPGGQRPGRRSTCRPAGWSTDCRTPEAPRSVSG